MPGITRASTLSSVAIRSTQGKPSIVAELGAEDGVYQPGKVDIVLGAYSVQPLPDASSKRESIKLAEAHSYDDLLLVINEQKKQADKMVECSLPKQGAVKGGLKEWLSKLHLGDQQAPKMNLGPPIPKPKVKRNWIRKTVSIIT